MKLLLDLPSALPLAADEFIAVPEIEGVRMELWEGNLLLSALAQMAWHSMVAARIETWVRGRHPDAARGVGVVVAAHSVLVPDVTVFHEPLIDLRRSQFPAEDVQCVVEVVSPESTKRDRVTKPLMYAAAGIPEFWLVEEHPDVPSDALVQQHRLTPTADAYTVVRTIRLSDLEESQ